MSRATPDATLAHVELVTASLWIFPPLNAAALHPLTALMFQAVRSVGGFINKPNKTKSDCAHPPTSTEHTAERGLGGRRPGLVPGRDFFFTWLQPNYSRQLEPSLPSRTTRLAADLVPADAATAAVLDTHLMVPLSSPDPLNGRIFFFSLPSKPQMFFLVLLLIMVHTETVCRGLTFRR